MPAARIVCVDCGGVAHLLTVADHDRPLRTGDRLVYRCSDCNDRWDLIVEEDDLP